MEYTTLKPKEIKADVLAGGSIDLQFYQNALDCTVSRYVHNGAMLKRATAYKIIEELELVGVDTVSGCSYIVPMLYTVMVQHYGKQPQPLYSSESQVDARDMMRDQCEILKGYHTRWGVIEGAFIVFGSDGIHKIRIWMKKERLHG